MDGTDWQATTAGTRTGTSTTATGVTTFGDFEVGESAPIVPVNSITFQQPPTSTAAGATITPAVQVLIQDSSNAALSGVPVKVVVTNGTLNGTLTQLSMAAAWPRSPI